MSAPRTNVHLVTLASALATYLAGCASSTDTAGFGADAGEPAADASLEGASPSPDAAVLSDARTLDGASARDGSADAGVDAALVDAAWGGRPPAAPLLVRDPYLSTWSAADAPNTAWPSFWNGATKGMAGIARVDGAPFVFLGTPAGLTPTAPPMGFVSQILTPTKTEVVFAAGGVALTVDFLSPVEPGDLQRQSAPLGYVTAHAVSTDGASHAVSLYFDISGEWAHGDSTQSINWTKETVARPGGGGNLVVQSFTPASPQPLVQSNEAAAWGTAFVATGATAMVTTAIGQDTVVRSLATSTGVLDGSVDTSMPRAIDAQWPVLGFAFQLGMVSATPSSPVTLVLGHARDPGISYLGTPVPPLWKAYWPTWQAMVADAYDDGPAAGTRAAALDSRIVSDARAAGGDHYAALCTLGLRQAFGGTQLVGTAAQPWLMLKEISSDGNVSTVDVVYPASPAFLYTNPLLLKLMLDPLLAYAEKGGWPKVFAEHDLGASYPVAAGHNDGNEEDMPIEETANMLILMAAYAQRAKPADATAYAMAHYTIAKQWADYLTANTLDPACQNQTDDFTGHICHSVNLALKGIVGVGAMSILSGFAGNAADQKGYLGQAQTLVGQWATMAQDGSGKHLLMEYDVQGQWSLKYNALYDRILGLNLVPAAVLSEETSWYAAQVQPFGILMDPRNSYTKTDWTLWAAAALDDPSLRTSLVDAVYAFATTTTARVPFGDWYCVQNGPNASDNSMCVAGQWKGFQARPVQGGLFSLLAREANSIVMP